jgi:hypothetical protein
MLAVLLRMQKLQDNAMPTDGEDWIGWSYDAAM